MPVSPSKKTVILDPAALQTALVPWFKNNGRDLPWRRTHDPYAILVSEIMLQQTQVVTVLDYFARWMKRFPDFATLAAASEPEVLALWQGLGYYSRARNLHRAAKVVLQEHHGKMPSDPAEIRKLPGIGRYTAGAVATFAFDVSTPIVDANIARVLARLMDMRLPIDSTAGQSAIWNEAEALQPEKKAGLFNSALMELGALICLPRSPKCLICPVQKICRAVDPGTLPIKKPRRKVVELSEDSAWIIKNGRILLEQQNGSRWKGLWKLPLMAIEGTGELLQFHYPFTHHRVTLSVFAQPVPAKIGSAQRWFKLNELHDIPLAAPHRRAIERLMEGPRGDSIYES